jgi:hypothetical protein
MEDNYEKRNFDLDHLVIMMLGISIEKFKDEN